ncbi:MAG: imidazole glycerol phosphate synthase subunit HisH [Candidatus Aquicultor secundus]|uniref:Imidazole glycerol phosphate synthase subunit HisH n=1 Tax=Candidatus Aquicultor secundus TaxID=1973895 RepID=A0A2M7TA87_9ACTN|nr:imidazole glycerol phosphate synthase subunit HisH [Candidatus Aquicultor secundus]NCO66485.1 imidazole glycerol phosphate synthase subunit HisH [Solirubrobacter sp.]PIU26076.1 MAG: imidazole glycerol phosphate synthase subunit HisH [Candidatus Aquicultor secundus]PIW21653.1 MAG: imidazole glycerol phosphate synthase subunit HisH [Candidatus Aquicultor secundus]PIX52542.1 MAG: imidazole glycerol phosphate synthase subunit HisH [Candidatus Aquicultor secundus]PIY39326.1 MAG: imidazole glycer
MIAIIDYGMGNLRSVEKAFEKLGFEVAVSDDPGFINKAQGVVLPGVGAFADCMANLKSAGLEGAVYDSINSSKPFLGICLGLQLLMEESEEDGIHKGLGVFNGRVRRLPEGQKIPHMGWNQVRYANKPPIFEGVPEGSNFYFVHSYYVDPSDTGIIATVTDYGFEFTSSIWSDNVFAVQFHPEKSGDVGLKVLENFGRLCK